jgi:hypothetical protein
LNEDLNPINHHHFDWKNTCEMEPPNYVNYLCSRQDNSFIACADNSIHILAVTSIVEADHAKNDFDRLKL